MRQKLLEGAGYEVVSLDNSKQALHIFSPYFPCIDLVVLDYAMPGMDGCVVAQEIKRYTQEVPIIIVSGYPIPEETPTCVCCIAKGESPALLLEKIGQLLAPRSAVRSVEQATTTIATLAPGRADTRSAATETGRRTTRRIA